MSSDSSSDTDIETQDLKVQLNSKIEIITALKNPDNSVFYIFHEDDYYPLKLIENEIYTVDFEQYEKEMEYVSQNKRNREDDENFEDGFY